jgi:hypothetical protein
MRTNLLFCTIGLLFGIALSGCSDPDPAPVKTDDLVTPVESANPPQNTNAILSGEFSSFAHNLAGRATVYAKTDGNKILRLENFTMTQGPDVYVFFSKSNNYSMSNTIALSKLTQGYSAENIQFDYKFVLVYCVKYSSLFGYAELQ